MSNKTNKQVASAFAAGQASESNNMKTDGQRLWSYGTMIGTKIQGQVILSDDSMSPTTGRHIGLASRAVGYADIRADIFRYGASNPAIHPVDVVDYLISKSINHLNKSARARSNRDYLVNSARSLFQQAKDLCNVFGLSQNCCYPTDTRDAVTLGIIQVG